MFSLVHSLKWKKLSHNLQRILGESKINISLLALTPLPGAARILLCKLIVFAKRRDMTFILTFLALISLSFANPKLINGIPVGEKFQGVGTFNVGCTITKVGPRQFISAAHCVGKNLPSLTLNFKNFKGTVKVTSAHIHPSWIKDCSNFHCTGHEVGSSRMTPGRSDVVFINVKEETPAIPIIAVHFDPLQIDTSVAMVGAGCTRSVEPGGPGKMRYFVTKLVSPFELTHEHSLYKNIFEVTGQSNWITPGYGLNRISASLCPGDSGGPLLSEINGEWKIVGIAADYTFDGPYQDGAPTITNLHTRLDDQSFNSIGQWIRDAWENP